MGLPKAVLHRIHRYSSEGSKLRTVFGPGDHRLLAETLGQVPIVILRASEPKGFAQMRSEALVEWMRASRRLKRQK